MGKKSAVLIGAAGTGVAYAAVSALRRTWGSDVFVLAVDTNTAETVTASLLADRFEIVPSALSPDYPDVVCALLERYAIDTYVPFVDYEIKLAAEISARSIISSQIKVLAPKPEVAGICLDKLIASQWLSDNGFSSPKTSSALEPFAADSYVLKPRLGFGSRGVKWVTAEELLRYPRQELEDCIVQEICDGGEITIDCFFDPEKDYFYSLCRERLEVKSGVCTKARIYYSEQFHNISHSLARKLGLIGGFCYQIMKAGDSWMITDINARLGAGTAMSVAVGQDFFTATFLLTWGLPYRHCFSVFPRERYVTRQYAEFVMN